MKKFAFALVLATAMMLPLSASALVKKGQPYVPFELSTDEGKMVKSDDFVGKGKIVVLAFMNTVCSTCSTEIQLLAKLAQKEKGFLFYPIAVDMRGEKTVAPYKKINDYDFPFLLDPDFSLGRKYGATYTPYTVVIGKDGIVMDKFGGYDDATGEKLTDIIK